MSVLGVLNSGIVGLNPVCSHVFVFVCVFLCCADCVTTM